MDKALTALLGVVLAIGMFMAFSGMAEAATPFTCPICGEEFGTYDELYEHFITEHPSTPIDIIWE